MVGVVPTEAAHSKHVIHGQWRDLGIERHDQVPVVGSEHHSFPTPSRDIASFPRILGHGCTPHHSCYEQGSSHAHQPLGFAVHGDGSPSVGHGVAAHTVPSRMVHPLVLLSNGTQLSCPSEPGRTCRSDPRFRNPPPFLPDQNPPGNPPKDQIDRG
eukprot:scaffold524_cov357-Pavlova_lutheri.AAC.23